MGFCTGCRYITINDQCPKCKKVVDGKVHDRIDHWQNQYADSILRGRPEIVPQSSISTPCAPKGPRRVSLLPRNTCAQCNTHVAAPFLYEGQYCKMCYANMKGKSTTKPSMTSRTPGKKNASQAKANHVVKPKTAAHVSPDRNVPLRKPVPSDAQNTVSSSLSSDKESQDDVPTNIHGRSRLLQQYQKSVTLPPSPVSSASPSPPLATQTKLTPQPQATQSQKRKTCAKCNQMIVGRRAKLELPGGSAWFHLGCLECSVCHGSFSPDKQQSIVMTSDRKLVFHAECRPPSPPNPAPSVSVPAPSLALVRCQRCQIQAAAIDMLRYDSHYYHAKCFNCYSCHNPLIRDKPFHDINDEIYCWHCALDQRQKIRKSSIHVPAPIQALDSSTSTPSVIWKNRTTALPKLGGTNTCPRCKESVSFLEDVPGPLATRWHKKCLRCNGCEKVMDSSAKVIRNERNGWSVQCIRCQDKQAQPRFVR